MMRKVFVILWCFFSFVHVLLAQQMSAADAIRKINNAYLGMSSISCEIEVTMYTDASRSAAISSYSGKYMKSGTSYYLNMAGAETLYNDRYIVNVNRQRKHLLISQNNKSDYIDKKTFLSRFLSDSVLQQYKNVQTKIKDKTSSSFTMTYPMGDYKSIEIVYDPSSWLVKEIVIVLRSDATYQGRKITNPVLVMSYTKTKVNAKIASSELSEKRFFTMIKGKAKAVKAYKTFKIFQNTPNNLK